MKERKKNIYKGIAKTIMIKAVRDTIISDIIAIILAQYLFKSIGVMDASRETIIIFWKFFLMVLSVANLALLFMAALMHTDEEKKKINKKLAEDIFSKDTCVKVFPKEGHLKYKDFFEKELPQIADYFAILQKYDKIKIIARFDGYDKDLFIECVEKENFINGYEVFETV